MPRAALEWLGIELCRSSRRHLYFTRHEQTCSAWIEDHVYEHAFIFAEIQITCEAISACGKIAVAHAKTFHETAWRISHSGSNREFIQEEATTTIQDRWNWLCHRYQDR